MRRNSVWVGWNFLILAVTSIVGFCASAHAAKIALVGVANTTTPTDDPVVTTYKGKMAYGGGVLVGFRAASHLELELGALYVSHQYDGTAGAIRFTDRFNSIEVPLVFRLHFIPLISLGAGVYFDSITKDNNPGITKDGFGALGSVALRIPFGMLTSFLIDGRYQIGLSDRDAGVVTQKFNDLQILAGLQFSMF